MNIKRETSVSVTELHNVSDSIKRLAISVDGHPEISSKANSEEVIEMSAPPTAVPHQYNQPHYGQPPQPPTQATYQGRILSVLSTAKTDFHGKYEIVKEVGRGGFSTVYQCREKASGAIYAVKVVDLRPLRLRERFNPIRLRREVDIMRRLKHPNIIQFVEVYETADQLLMVMEYCPGDELFDVILARKFFSEKDAKAIFAQIARSVYYLHSLNIIHRDIKPENVLVMREPDPLTGIPRCKLLDFGLSKNAGNSSAKTFVGTPCYLAPEVEYTSKGLGGTYGLPADCWSLGSVLYVMLVARFPEFEQDDTGKVVLRLPPVLWDDISNDAKDLIRSLMNTNPAARQTVAGALQHPWLGEYRATTHELSSIAVSCYDLGRGLQEEEERLMRDHQIESREEVLTATGETVHRHAMVVRTNNNHNNNNNNSSGNNNNSGGAGGATMGLSSVGVGVVDDATLSPEQLALRPLLHLQRSIAQCFREAHAFYADIPEVATQIRQGAALSRQQLMESTKMLRKVEQTASAVLQMFPDLELAVEEGEPELANAFFNMVRGWVLELRTLVHSTQEINKASMAQIQKIVEQSTLGLQSRSRASNGIINAAKFSQLSQRLTDLLRAQQRRLGNGGNESSSPREGGGGSSGDTDSPAVTLSSDDFLELFVGLFGAQAQSGSSSPMKNVRGVSWPGHQPNSPLLGPSLGPVVEEPRVSGSTDIWDIDADADDVVASRRSLNGNNLMDLFTASNSPPPPGVGLRSDRVQNLSDSEPSSPLRQSRNTSAQPTAIHSACESSRNSPYNLSRDPSHCEDAVQLGRAAEAMRIDSTDDVSVGVGVGVVTGRPSVSVLHPSSTAASSGVAVGAGVVGVGVGVADRGVMMYPRVMPALLTNAPNGEAEAVPLQIRIGGDHVRESSSSNNSNISGQEHVMAMSPQMNTAAAKLNEALQKLRQVDVILEQLSVFWANTDVVLDVLTKKGQHIEQFINFAHKPRLLARFRERMEEYKRFWEGMHIMCSNYIQGVCSPPTNAAGGPTPGSSSSSMDTGGNTPSAFSSSSSSSFVPVPGSPGDFSSFQSASSGAGAGIPSMNTTTNQKGGLGGLYDFLDRNNSSGSDHGNGTGGFNMNSFSGGVGAGVGASGGFATTASTSSSRSYSNINSNISSSSSSSQQNDPAGWMFSHGSAPPVAAAATAKGAGSGSTQGHTHVHTHVQTHAQTAFKSTFLDKIDSA